MSQRDYGNSWCQGLLQNKCTNKSCTEGTVPPSCRWQSRNQVPGAPQPWPYLSGLWAANHSVPTSCPGQSYVLLNTWKESKVQLSASLNSLDVCTETTGPSPSGDLEIHAWFFLISISFIQIVSRAEEKNMLSFVEVALLHLSHIKNILKIRCKCRIWEFQWKTQHSSCFGD